MGQERKKEVINVCLDHFIEKGLTETSTRSLSSALKLQNGGLYYYFESKDEVVVLCAEEAAMRLEKALILPTVKRLDNPELMVSKLKAEADKMAPTMSFLVSVCASKRYKDKVKPVLDRLSERYGIYVDAIAKKLGCEQEAIEPYVYMAITAVANYMIFEEDVFVVPHMEIVKAAIRDLTHTDAG